MGEARRRVAQLSYVEWPAIVPNNTAGARPQYEKTQVHSEGVDHKVRRLHEDTAWRQQKDTDEVSVL